MNILIEEEERFMFVCLFVSVLSAFCARFMEAIVRCCHGPVTRWYSAVTDRPIMWVLQRIDNATLA